MGRAESSAAYPSLRLIQEGDGRAFQRWKLGLHHIPHDSIIDLGVAVNQDISKHDDAPMFWNSCCNYWVEAGQLRQSFPDISD